MQRPLRPLKPKEFYETLGDGRVAIMREVTPFADKRRGKGEYSQIQASPNPNPNSAPRLSSAPDTLFPATLSTWQLPPMFMVPAVDRVVMSLRGQSQLPPPGQTPQPRRPIHSSGRHTVLDHLFGDRRRNRAPVGKGSPLPPPRAASTIPPPSGPPPRVPPEKVNRVIPALMRPQWSTTHKGYHTWMVKSKEDRARDAQNSQAPLL